MTREEQRDHLVADLLIGHLAAIVVARREQQAQDVLPRLMAAIQAPLADLGEEKLAERRKTTLGLLPGRGQVHGAQQRAQRGQGQHQRIEFADMGDHGTLEALGPLGLNDAEDRLDDDLQRQRLVKSWTLNGRPRVQAALCFRVSSRISSA